MFFDAVRNFVSELHSLVNSYLHHYTATIKLFCFLVDNFHRNFTPVFPLLFFLIFITNAIFQAFHKKSHKADDYVRMIQARLDQV